MIVIVDYGVGNVGSVHNMLRKVGAKARVSGDETDIRSADKLILPGVGHFGHGMTRLRETGLIPLLEEQALHTRKPVLGICLGMQMMTRGSEESDEPGLGWVDAFTHRFPEVPGLRIPHMGWNAVRPGASASLFAHDAPEPERFYFVHSYYVKPAATEQTAAACRYGVDFAASFEAGNLFGVQFHPEKSHLFGMALLRRFAAL
ncbi:imidazole glycerol phosphate synthase subunit HisH [Noviherbaspirillum aridicola]|uniref:Imidazole glycerol phosphate synthase subunit HisH n=1 Tax=Noviherbaspirillum aridicola TaxID=2849687 RepID=A0ABQ4Q2P6_9BURK|nr:imidazole glycerol phosphate synthase subunit HisH [Noviherbaspirillum aridicola]GIZ51306.1 imidazole glycerol phosphate synthase subunit HisH 2 [Noviherbaspirillum aridicola]